MKTAIVTGANGFVGSRLTKYLLNRGYEVYALVDKENNDEEHKNIHYVISNLGELDSLVEVLPYEADILYHLAWKGVKTSLKNDEFIQLQNIEFSLNILKLSKMINVKKIICSGSISEYAHHSDLVTGHEEPSPSDMYGACKVASHYICETYAKRNDLNFNWVLISSIYGPGRDDNNLITYTIKKILNGEPTEFTKLEQRWDYIYIDDLVDALFSVGTQGKKGETYPIGSGLNRPLSYYVYAIRNKIDKTISLGIGKKPYKSNTIDNSMVDISRIIMDTDFKPKYSFDDGIGKTIDYYREKRD